MPKLVCQAGPNAGHEYPLNKDVTILGRQSSCDVQVQDDMSSRAHCQLRRDGQLYSLVDLGSRNGTLLNGKKVSERLLSFGDIIRIGKVEYLLVKEPKDLELKDLLSKYEIQEKLGEGGMGIVYKANQRSMARVVALKILSPKYASKTKFVEQFTREARAAGSLNHPNIIQVHDVGTENGIHYFSMEFVDGPTCMQVLKAGGPFPVPDALEIVRQTARALEYAHGHRLIHQDIKPDNIMLGPNNIVKLADLGISKTFDEVEADEVKKVMGTPHYMAPEAALGKKVDHRVDIYSLGATAYHLLSGRTPYHGSSPTEVLKHHVMDPLPPITEVNPAVPPKVVALIERMMAKKPEDRLQSASEVVEEVRQATGNESSTDRVGGETMILRRYAKGGPVAASVPTPASLTTGNRTPGGETTTPGEGADAIEGDIRLRLLNRLLVGGVIIAVIAFAAILASNLLGGSSGKNSPGTGPTTTGPSVDPIKPTGPDPAMIKHDQIAQRLADIEHEIGRDSEHVDLDKVNKELDSITDNDLDAANHERANQLQEHINALVQTRHEAEVRARFSKLSDDSQACIATHEYDKALNLIDVFPARDRKVVKQDYDRLRAEVEGEKAKFHTDMLNAINEAYNMDNRKALEEMRDKQLPASYLGSDLEQEIAKDISAISNRQQAQMGSVVAEGEKMIANWDFEQFNNDYNLQRPQLEGDAAVKYDKEHTAVAKVAAMVKALSERLRKHQVRYQGNLRMSPDPDLIDATLADGLVMNDESGGRITLKWQLLSPDLVANVVDQVLGKGADAEYLQSVETLWAIKPAANKPK
jgi:serine/threonine protein kinase